MDLAAQLAGLGLNHVARATRATVVGVSHRGTRTVVGFGADRPTADSPFRIASLTKPFTAAALALALRDRAIPLATPAIDLLPALAPDWRADRSITIEHLLGQVAGLRDEVTADAVAALGAGDEALQQTARLVVAAGSDRAPGQRWAYYNGNYFLAGAILAAVTDATYESAVTELVLAPWGLRDTEFARVTDYPRGRRPSGGLWSTVGDVLSLGERIQSDEELQQVIATPRTAPGDPMTYGLGWALGPSGQLFLNGRLPGYRSALLAIPAQQFVGVALTNSEDGLPAAAAALNVVQREFTGDDLAEAIERFAE